jgi:TetR/AcrR family transcriptional regulator
MVDIFESSFPNQTEKQILVAARKVFMKKGMDGARMQEIADEANINKAMLHYYFRTKERLFHAIFREAFQQFFPQLEGIFTLQVSFQDKISLFIDRYMDLLFENPFLPAFILSEINRNPQAIVSVFDKTSFNPEALLTSIESEMIREGFRRIHPMHFLINIVSMCVFPFAGGPLIKAVFPGKDPYAYDSFLRERKDAIYEFVMFSLKHQE